MRRRVRAHAAQGALLAVLALAACGSPLDEFDTLDGVALADEGAAATLSEPPDAPAIGGEGFLGRLFGVSGEAAAVETGGTAQDDDPPEEIGGTDAIPGDDTMDAAAAEDAAPRRGLFGLFGGAAADPPGGPVAELMPAGLQLSFGEIGTVCGLSARDLGTATDRRNGYTLHDTAPGSAAPRTFYLTGFPDDCARQFTGVLVLFGDAAFHETIRYSAGTADIPYTETDVAYEEIKARVCGVASGQPCGGAIDRLSAQVLFLTVYSRFESSRDWAEILIHDGVVVAKAVKSS